MALPVRELVERAREQLSELTGLELSSTLGAARGEEGWDITVEVVEKHSLPDQMDILAIYDVRLDDDGNLLEFNRTRLRKRIDTEEAGEE